MPVVPLSPMVDSMVVILKSRQAAETGQSGASKVMLICGSCGHEEVEDGNGRRPGSGLSPDMVLRSPGEAAMTKQARKQERQDNPQQQERTQQETGQETRHHTTGKKGNPAKTTKQSRGMN